LTRHRPRNRTVTECRKFKAIDPQTKTAIKIYCHVDREFLGGELGPVVAIRIQMRHAKGSLMDGVLAQVSDHLSAEVQTSAKGAG
jgi:hypothetical protein